MQYKNPFRFEISLEPISTPHLQNISQISHAPSSLSSLSPNLGMACVKPDKSLGISEKDQKR